MLCLYRREGRLKEKEEAWDRIQRMALDNPEVIACELGLGGSRIIVQVLFFIAVSEAI